MYTVETILGEGNPNPKVASFKVNWTFPKGYGKIIVPRDGLEIRKYCVLADALYIRAGDAVRVDLAHHKDGTLISVARKMMAFDDENRARLRARLSNLFNDDPDFEPVDIKGIEKNIKVNPTLSSSTNLEYALQNAFYEAVNKALSEDGGAMELLAMDYSQETGEIQMKVALFGACNTCPGAETITLAGAEQKMTLIVDGLKEKYKDNQKHDYVQKLKIMPIKTETVQALVFAR